MRNQDRSHARKASAAQTGPALSTRGQKGATFLPLWLQGATLVMSLCATGVRAEAPSDAGASAQSSEKTPELLEEIVITADKKDSFGANYVQAGTFRNARVIDTPTTVNILPRAILDAEQATNFGDALKNSSGVTFAQTNPSVTTNISIRGIPVENRSNYRLDGSLPIVNFVDLPLEDKDRVEVLKGVGSLYYGFTTPSGIVNVVMKRPTADPLTNLAVSANQYGGYNGAVDLSRRFGDDKFGIRINGAGGQVETGVDHVVGHRAVGAVALDWDPIKSVSVRLDAEYVQKKITETALFLLPLTKGVLTPANQLPPLLDPKTNLGSEWMATDAHQQNLLGHVEWRFSENWAIMAEAGRSHARRDRHLTTFTNWSPTTELGTLTERVGPTSYDNQNYRTELAGGFETGPLVHQVSIGGSYNLRVTNTYTPVTATLTPQENYLNPVQYPETVFAIPDKLQTAAPIHDKGTYAFDKISYSSWLDVLAAIRHNDYSSNTITIATQKGTPYSATKNSPSGAIVVKPTTDVSVYVSYMEGLEEGGLAPNTAANSGQVLQPGVTKQKEAGIKAKPIEPLMLSLAYFDINRPTAYTNAQNIFALLGRTSYKGVEGSASGEIGTQFSLMFNAMYEDAKIENAATATAVGMRPENTPEWSASGFVEWRPVFGGLGSNLGITAGLQYVGNRAVDSVSGPNELFIGGFTTFDLGARYTWQLYGNPTTVRFKVDNLTNKRYWAGTGADYLTEGLPRMAKLNIETQF